MRTTVVLDDVKIAQAIDYTGIQEKSALIDLALTTLIELEASRRLARLGGSLPNAQETPRRRPPDFLNDTA